MGVEKEGTKSGGGYVGGFFQLFDWTSKSRKKLFANKSELPEPLKHGRKANYKKTMTQPYLANEDESEVLASVRRSCDHSYASSVTDDESCGTRAPNVVAKLMGLDSLPPSHFSDPYSSPYFDTLSLQESQYFSRNLNDEHDHQTLYSGKLIEKAEGSSRNYVEPKPQKTVTRPIEKFQTEVLPPKSAKSIPVTHHKLLSPIKCPGFVPTNNAAYIMEAAARIIEPGSQFTTKAKTHLVSSSAVSLRVKDLKDKVEASQKGSLIGPSLSRARDLKGKREISHRTTRISEPSERSLELNAAKYLKGQPLNKSWNGSVDTSSIRSPTYAEEDSSLKNKGRSISLAVQAKVNVQRREGLSSSGGRSMVGQKEHLDTKPNQKSKANVQKILHKKSSGALRQNNLKQNGLVEKDKLPSKPSVSNSHSRKVLSSDSPYSRHRSSSSKSIAKVGSRKSATEVTDSEKEVLYTSTNNFPRKKRTTDKDWNDRVVDNLFIDKTPKPVQPKLVSNKQYNWAEETTNKDTDVVSFTFTTPLSRKNPGLETSGQARQKTIGLSLDQRIKRVSLDTDNTRSPIGYNVIGGDALGMLLEQKLRELTNAVETSCHDVSRVRQPSKAAPKSNNTVTKLNLVNLNARLQQKKDQDVLFTDNISSSQDSGISFTGLPEISSKHNSWVDEMDPLLFNGRQPSPISVLEPSLSIESYESSMSTDITSTEGSKLCPSVQAQDVHCSKFSTKFHPAEPDAELSDSASSTSIGTKHTSTFVVMKFGARSSTWELDYVKDILSNAEMMYMDFSLGQTRTVVDPRLFNKLESGKGGFEFDDGVARIRRKVIFDCVSEYLDLRYKHYVGGGYKMWAKGVAMLKRNEWLAEEVYKEIPGWRKMGDSMVDELVDKDMSSQYGRWLDFEVDAFELGAEIADQMFNYLVDDVVADILHL
ncbi:hypothetical protein TanjilG_26528 [Lupinus angustifolius]|uniref:DUF4378 domain-containing protein n=1 Tax=Lupinus angustifolius TaxID=3871 RepID=A0A4P1QPJ4_LUPAN|nr:PREDICTED: uncharacterized protein LOC109334602 [Lupinus angustifolius]OIV91675.1 hypothetical protein TanjilG_26528 [Lupinus angustifolius]